MLGLALAYGGFAQLLAGMWEFKTGNTFGAVAFTSYGAFWIATWLLLTFNAGGLANADHAISLYFWAWAIFTAYMSVAALRVSGSVLLVFVLLTATFVFLAIGQNNLPASGVDTMHKMAAGSVSRPPQLPGMPRLARREQHVRQEVVPLFPLSGRHLGRRLGGVGARTARRQPTGPEQGR